jgi:repressor LexA
MQKDITPRQKQVLEFIENHIAIRGYPPTVREIGKAVNLSSSSTVHAHLKALETAGFIKREAVLTRAIIPVQRESSALAMQNVRYVPVLGRIAAGIPTLASEDLEEMFPLPHDFLAGGDGFMLRVKGESMIEDGIMNGDLVIVRKQETAENGDIIVAMIENEATVKHFFREDDKIRLQPANSNMAAIYAPSVSIVGKVVGLVRRM